MRASRYRRSGHDWQSGGFAPAERDEANLFVAELFGERPRPSPPAFPVPRRLPVAASWSRPDLIFDYYAYRPLDEAEALMGELADEGWIVIALPGSDTPPSQLRWNDVVIQRALGDGRLAYVRAYGAEVDARDLYGPGGLIRTDTLVLRRRGAAPEPAPEIVEDAPATTTSSVAGETIVHLPLLTAHAARGFSYDLTGPNCVLRWARLPSDFSGALDVIVHFHGYKAHNAMRLQDKANASGLDLDSSGVTRPTLGLVPHGHAFVSNMKGTDGFDFPAMANRAGLQRFLDAALAAFKKETGSSGRSLTIDRVILTGHSGGGAALNNLMRSIGSGDGAHAFHYFDATYGGAGVMTDGRGWLISALSRDAQLLQGVSDDAERARLMRERGGSLRLLFIDGTLTAPTARAVDRFISNKLRTLVTDDSLRAFLRQYYRAQRVANPRTVDHSRVPRTFGGRLLADAGASLDPDARDLEAPRRAPSEDMPTTAAGGAAVLDRVRSAIAATLQSFKNILVTVPAPTGRDLSVQTPYFINRATSPSKIRAEEKRPALLRNEALERLYRVLPARARVGKSQAGDIRTFLQGAIDATAVPGQSGVLTADLLNAFLSDVGVGVDCSGFVCHALNACMAALGRTDTIDANNTSSGHLRGGSGHNDRFDLIARPSDLSPGDTMWKSGHIRIVHTVEPQSDGSIQFTTAESSSVNLVGPVAKRWKCPQADRFTGMKVERSGTWRDNTERNAFSRWKPLGEALRVSGPVAPTEDVPTTGATLTQAEIDRLTAIDFGNAADIDAFFSRGGAAGFVGWFNSTLGGKPPFKRASGATIRMGTGAQVQQRFTAFWNSIPTAYDRPRINALDFAGLMCIVLNETEGDFYAHTERCGKGRTDARGPHPGLAYAFDKIVDVKASYNVLSGNRRAGDLFNDADFIRAHGSLGGGTRLANHGGDFGGAWNSAYYPQNDFSTAEDLTENGFIMQADFYKFRGRGVIQTTARESYLRAVRYIQGYSGTNAVLNDFKQRWSSLRHDVAATVSTDADWTLIFSQGEMLAKAVRLHSGTGTTDYLTMSNQANVLLDVPARLEKGVARGLTGSIYFMGRRISGSYRYGSGLYRDRVIATLTGMLAL